MNFPFGYDKDLKMALAMMKSFSDQRSDLNIAISELRTWDQWSYSKTAFTVLRPAVWLQAAISMFRPVVGFEYSYFHAESSRPMVKFKNKSNVGISKWLFPSSDKQTVNQQGDELKMMVKWMQPGKLKIEHNDILIRWLMDWTYQRTHQKIYYSAKLNYWVATQRARPYTLAVECVVLHFTVDYGWGSCLFHKPHASDLKYLF